MENTIEEFGKQILESKQYENIPNKSKSLKKNLKNVFQSTNLHYLKWFIAVYLKEVAIRNGKVEPFRQYMAKRFKEFFDKSNSFSYKGNLKSLTLFEEYPRSFIKDRLSNEIDFGAQFQVIKNELIILYDDQFKKLNSYSLTKETINFFISQKEYNSIKNKTCTNEVINFFLESDGNKKPIFLCTKTANEFIITGIYKFKKLTNSSIVLINIDSAEENNENLVDTQITNDESLKPISNDEKFVLNSRNYLFQHFNISACSKYVDKYVLKDVPENNKIRFVYTSNKSYEDFVGKKVDGNFIPGAFVYALLKAYESEENFYLIIENVDLNFEEKIFNDLSFLLPRNNEGESAYSIFNYDLISLFKEKNINFNGNNIKLPRNLFIICTTKDEKIYANNNEEKWQFVSLKNEPKYIEFIKDLYIPLVHIKWENFVNKMNTLHALNNTQLLSISDANESMLINENKPIDEKLAAEKFFNNIIDKLWNYDEEYRKEIFNDFSIEQIKDAYLNDDDKSSFEIIFKCYSSIVVVSDAPTLDSFSIGDSIEF